MKSTVSVCYLPFIFLCQIKIVLFVVVVDPYEMFSDEVGYELVMQL